MVVEFDEVANIAGKFNEAYKDLKPTPVFFYPYLKRVLETRFKELNPQFPMDIKIPKSNKALLKGDFEPEKVIHLEEPLRREDGTPIWFSTTASEMFLRFGYRNLDARYISDAKMDMEYIHAFLGGSSGHGKSVTINSMLAGLFYEYAPWELQVHMSDAKIIEFKKYGVGNIIPHISTIAATEDADFVISVLGKAFDEMNQRAKIFGNIGVSNLKSFRKKTGLAYPRVLIVMDEVESTFKLAGKQAGKIADYIDGFARLGRAAGYHIFMATQNMSSDIPKSATGQIRIRCCLGANETTSEAVLGNSGATDNFGRIGRLIVNTEVLNGGKTFPHNVTYQTPFLTDDNFGDEMKELEMFGRKVEYSQPLSFYDEEDIKTVDSFRPVIDRTLTRLSKSSGAVESLPVVLGYPAFVTDDPDGLLKVSFEFKDIENLVICSSQIDRISAHLANIAHSIKDSANILHYSSDVDMFKWTPMALSNEECRDATTSPLDSLDSVIKKRLFLLQVDNLAKNENRVKYSQENVEAIFARDGIPKDAWNNSLMCRRATVFYAAQKQHNFASIWKDVAPQFPSFKPFYDNCVRYNSIIAPMTTQSFGKIAFFIGDLSKILGYGRDSKSAPVTKLKKTLQDASRAGVVFILYTRSMENLNDLYSGLRYAIFDSPESKDWGRLRAEPPVKLSSKLGVLYDTQNVDFPQRKFKTTLLNEE